MKILDIIVTVLLIIGGLNWGLIGFFNYNLVAAIVGEATAWYRVFYAFVGLGALYELFSFAFGWKEVQHRWCEAWESVKH